MQSLISFGYRKVIRDELKFCRKFLSQAGSQEMLMPMSSRTLSARKTERGASGRRVTNKHPSHVCEPSKREFPLLHFVAFASVVMKGHCFLISCMGSIVWTPLLSPWAICATLILSSHIATGENSIRESITIKEQGALKEMTDPTQPTVLPDGIGQSWNCKFWEDFTTPNCLQDRFWHPCGSGKWKWDAVTWKEIHWEPACSQIVQDPATQKSILRVCVFSDWFHRIDRLATQEQFGYGYYEARCRFKGASGMHSAFWLLPNAMDEVDTPPGLIPGGIEVDVVEHRGFNATNNDISTIGVTTMHWGGYGAHHHSAGYRESNLPTSNSDIWATYGVLHLPGGLRWFWNGKEVNSVPIWTSRSNFLYFSTEVNESGGWAGTDMSTYGTLADPAGYVEVDHCGFWEVQSSLSSPVASRTDSHEQPHEEL